MDRMPTKSFSITSRHLAPSEAVADILHQHGDGLLLHVAMLKSDTELSRDLLKQALEILMVFQPALRMRILSSTDKKGKVVRRFVEMRPPVVDLEVSEEIDRGKWTSVAEKELEKPFDSAKGPLWKGIYLPFTQHDTKRPTAIGEVKLRRKKRMSMAGGKMWRHGGALLFKIHQSLADSYSMLDMIRDHLVPILTRMLKRESMEGFHFPLSMSPPADDALVGTDRLPWKKRHHIKQEYSKHKLPAPKKQKDSKPGKPPPLSPPLFGESLKHNKEKNTSEEPPTTTMELISYNLSSEFSEQLLRECEKYNVPLRTVLLAASALAMGVLSKANNLDIHRHDILCSYPEDLRRYIHTQTGQDKPLGRWLGRRVQKLKPVKYLPSVEKFWKEVMKVEAHTRLERDPWDTLCYYKEMMKYKDTGAIARICHETMKSHMEVDVLDVNSSGPRRPSIDSALGDATPPTQSPTNRTTSAPQADVLLLDEHYHVRSLSDVSGVSLTLTSTVIGGRLMWMLGYNTRWINRGLAVQYIDTLHDLLKKVVHPTSVRISQMIHLPAFLRASSSSM